MRPPSSAVSSGTAGLHPHRWSQTNGAPTLTLTVDFDRPVRETNPSFEASEPNSAAVLDEMEAIRRATVEAIFSQTFTYVISPLGVVKSAKGVDEAWDAFRLKLEPLMADKAKRARLDATIAYFETGEGAVKSLSRQLPAAPTLAVARESVRSSARASAIRDGLLLGKYRGPI